MHKKKDPYPSLPSLVIFGKLFLNTAGSVFDRIITKHSFLTPSFSLSNKYKEMHIQFSVTLSSFDFTNKINNFSRKFSDK